MEIALSFSMEFRARNEQKSNGSQPDPICTNVQLASTQSYNSELVIIIIAFLRTVLFLRRRFGFRKLVIVR